MTESNALRGAIHPATPKASQPERDQIAEVARLLREDDTFSGMTAQLRAPILAEVAGAISQFETLIEVTRYARLVIGLEIASIDLCCDTHTEWSRRKRRVQVLEYAQAKILVLCHMADFHSSKTNPANAIEDE